MHAHAHAAACTPAHTLPPARARARRAEKRAKYSRRRTYRDAKDVDAINDRNVHFNKKAERFYKDYTAETKQNLERGTALPDRWARWEGSGGALGGGAGAGVPGRTRVRVGGRMLTNV